MSVKQEKGPSSVAVKYWHIMQTRTYVTYKHTYRHRVEDGLAYQTLWLCKLVETRGWHTGPSGGVDYILPPHMIS